MKVKLNSYFKSKSLNRGFLLKITCFKDNTYAGKCMSPVSLVFHAIVTVRLISKMFNA